MTNPGNPGNPGNRWNSEIELIIPMSNMAFQKELFPRGVRAALQNWDALRAAVDGGWGGQYTTEKVEWLEDVIVKMFQAGCRLLFTRPNFRPSVCR